MSIIEKLTEGIVNRDMKKEGHALLNKWTATGLLEGLDTQHQRQTMARLLENQAKELLRESSSMAAQDVEGFASVAFPIVRRVFAGLIANDLVSVQPMSLPSGLIFFLDFTFSRKIGAGNDADASRMGNVSGSSIYGTDKTGAGIIDGVNLIGSLKEDLSGPGRSGMTGYAYASPSASVDLTHTTHYTSRVINLSSSMDAADLKAIKYDADVLTLAANPHVHNILEVNINATGMGEFSNLDLDNLSAIQVLGADFATAISSATADAKQLRRLSKVDSSGNVTLYFIGEAAGAIEDTAAVAAALTASYPQADGLVEKSGGLGALGSFTYPLEGTEEIPEIDIKVDSTAITAQTKKLKAKWTPELGQDLNAYHNLDAEVELTSILSEQIALEIDREILADLVNGATAGTFYWSRSPGLFVNRETGAEIGSGVAAPDFTGTVSEWYETLIETINDVSAQIHRKTLRGGANFVVCGPEVANILEFTSGFRANVTADADKGVIGAQKAGSLSRKFDVIVDPYFPRNGILVGRKGGSFLESGYVYAPYVPLQTTPTIFGVEDFVPRKGVMTRYAKKMVRPDMYGMVIIRGLLGESGSST